MKSKWMDQLVALPSLLPHVGLARQGWAGGPQYRLLCIRACAPLLAVCLVIACVLAQFSLNNVHKRGLKHHHFIACV